MLGPLGKQDAYYKMLNIHVNTLREWCNCKSSGEAKNSVELLN